MLVLVSAVVSLGLVAPVAGSDHPAAGVSPAWAQTAYSAGADDETAKSRRFWVKDKHRYFSDWYAGRHRKMVPFGCTRAPYYAPSPRCSHHRGFHHGLDVAMPCGTRLYAGFRGTVVRPDASGSLGPAYGAYAFRLRNQRLAKDFVIGHVHRVYVQPGDHVAKGELIALSSDEGAPDGCHLHFEVRAKGTSYDSAVAPGRFIDLRRRR